MGSSLTETQFLVLTAASGALYLLFDAARYFLSQLGQVRLRSLGDPDGVGWFRYSPQSFSLISGSVLQFSLVSAVGFTVAALSSRGAIVAAITAILFWCLVALGWKFVLAFIPEDLAIVMLRAILPVSHIFYFIFWPVLRPLRWLIDRIEAKREREEGEEDPTDEQVQAYIDVGEEEGILEEGEGKLIQSIVDFGDRVARELMTPRVDIFAVEVSQPLHELARLFSESKYSRIPVYEQTIDRITGIIHIKDVFDAIMKETATEVKDLARPPLFVAESKRVSDLLREFQTEHLQIAIVVDEYGGTAGLITIEDVIEEIVGEIADEHEDEEESIVEIDTDHYLVNGLARIQTMEQLFDADLEGDDYETVAGLIFTSLGRVPKTGESVLKGGLLFEVDRVDKRRIYRVRIRRELDEMQARESER